MTKYFTIDELCKSSTAQRHGIKNVPTDEQKMILQQMIDNILQPLRKAWGKPIVVNSGYRCRRLNSLVKGSATSHHMCLNKTCAVDIEAHTRDPKDNEKLFNLIRQLDLPFCQLINEHDYQWIHVSYRTEGEPKRQVLRAKKVGNTTQYIPMT